MKLLKIKLKILNNISKKFTSEKKDLNVIPTIKEDKLNIYKSKNIKEYYNEDTSNDLNKNINDKISQGLFNILFESKNENKNNENNNLLINDNNNFSLMSNNIIDSSENKIINNIIINNKLDLTDENIIIKSETLEETLNNHE